MPTGKQRISALIARTLPEAHTWTDSPQAADLSSLPGCPAVYLLVAESDVPVQLATTQHLRRLAASRLLDPERGQHGKADLTEIVRGVRWRQAYSAFEARWWYYRLAREMYPKRYLRMISFGPAWYLQVDWQARVPELQVTKRIWRAEGEYVGPWLTHDTCHAALAGLRDLFDLCRYPEQVNRAPEGRRCAYADMGRCDAPCDGAVPLAHYIERCRAAWEFARGAVRPWIDQARERMTQAARDQRFEAAALIKKQVAWAWRWHDNWSPTVRPAEALNDLLVIPVTRRRAWRLFLSWRGDLLDGPIVSDRRLSTEAPAWLRDRLGALPALSDPGIRMEQSWLVAHFLQSKAGDASLAVPLPNAEVPADLEDVLARGLAERRATAATQAATAEAEVAAADEGDAAGAP